MCVCINKRQYTMPHIVHCQCREEGPLEEWWIMHYNLFQSSKARTRKISLPHPLWWQNTPDFLQSSLKASRALTQREIYENNRERRGTCLQKDPGASCCALPLFKESEIEMNLCDQKLLIFAGTTGTWESARRGISRMQKQRGKWKKDKKKRK